MATPPGLSQEATAPSKGAVSTPSKTPSRKHFRGGQVTIVVGSGDTKQTFTIHKDLLVFYSDYFRAALNGSFVEATDKKIDLFDVEQEVFEHFHAWLYTRKLASEDDEPLDWGELFELWVFGDRFQVPMLQNCVMDGIFAKYSLESSFNLETLKPVYKNTIGGSPLRKAVIELLTYKLSLGHEDVSTMRADRHKFFTVEILSDLVKELDTARRDKTPYAKTPKREKCFFHVHGKDEHC